MQQDALRRVQEMKRRSKGLTEPPDDTPPEPAAQPKAAPLFNLSGIDIDEEKALIGLLIYILYKQGADIKLLLALGYLLL